MQQTPTEILQEANKLIFVKKYQDADVLISSLLESTEGFSFGPAHLRRIELATRLGTLDKAKAEYEALLKQADKAQVAHACLVLIRQHTQDPEHAQAIQDHQEGIRQFGPSALAYYGIGLAMEAQGNNDRSVSNYDQCLSEDPDFFPAYFGLSQVFYREGNDKQGNHYFYLYEQAAPYNVYGNFETHKKLCFEFLEKASYLDAEASIQALSDWWLENKGYCPPEIQIYELMAMARIAADTGDSNAHDNRRAVAVAKLGHILRSDSVTDESLYFLAKTLTEFKEHELVASIYTRMIELFGEDTGFMQKIGGQLLTGGDIDLACQFFEEVYRKNPDNAELNFCRLVSRLKAADVQVDDYLARKERLKYLLKSDGDSVETLSVLHSLIASFPDDGDVQRQIGEIYLRLGNVQRATKHFEKMYEIDGLSGAAKLKYAAHEMQYGDVERSMQILDELKNHPFEEEQKTELYWLRAAYFLKKGEHEQALKLMQHVLSYDPWNVSFLVQEIICLLQIAQGEYEKKPEAYAQPPRIDQVLQQLSENKEDQLDWAEYDRYTDQLLDQHENRLAFCRAKLRYLYADGGFEALQALVHAASRYDASLAAGEFIKLLNTNFDSPLIFWALGMLYKELWQMEAAAMWLEQGLRHSDAEVEKILSALIYVELADCYIWQNRSVDKSIEYVKLAMELGYKQDSRVFSILAHGCLRLGYIREAEQYLNQVDRHDDPDNAFLRGLLEYRNGDVARAKEIWKPLLTLRSDYLRHHQIKQEVLRFYFDKEPYFKMNA